MTTTRGLPEDSLKLKNLYPFKAKEKFLANHIYKWWHMQACYYTFYTPSCFQPKTIAWAVSLIAESHLNSVIYVCSFPEMYRFFIDLKH